MTEISRRELMKQVALLGLSLPAVNNTLDIMRQKNAVGYQPVPFNRPVCPHGADVETATFIDPTATIAGAEHVTLGQLIYIAPFAGLLADQAPITIGNASNVQDNVTIFAMYARDRATSKCIEQAGLKENAGVTIADQCILAHGATVKGPASIGAGKGHLPVFLSFGAEVDGAILERNTAVSALARVGPGVRLRSGYVVLPGKNVTTQQEADTPALGKVRLIDESDIIFHETVIEVNVAFAQVYTRLFYDNPSNVQGINYNPGHTYFTPDRQLPAFQGVTTRLPSFPNRIIGAVYLADTLSQAQHVMGKRISLRADEGTPFHVGHIHLMGGDVIFHALEHTDLHIGNNVCYEDQVIVHGGAMGNKPTVIEDNVTLKSQSVVFRAHIGQGTTIGTKSAVISSQVAAGTVIPDHVIYLNNTIFGKVEW